jgi:hypothetical protein
MILRHAPEMAFNSATENFEGRTESSQKFTTALSTEGEKIETVSVEKKTAARLSVSQPVTRNTILHVTCQATLHLKIGSSS